MSGALAAKLTPDMIHHYLKPGGHEPNIAMLKTAVERLCLAASQKDAGQRSDSTPNNRVNWQSSEIDMLHFIILVEAVALVLSGKLDELKVIDNDIHRTS